jgi:hypothetical protein
LKPNPATFVVIVSTFDEFVICRNPIHDLGALLKIASAESSARVSLDLSSKRGNSWKKLTELIDKALTRRSFMARSGAAAAIRIVGLAEAIRHGCNQLRITIGSYRDKDQIVLKLRGQSSPN